MHHITASQVIDWQPYLPKLVSHFLKSHANQIALGLVKSNLGEPVISVWDQLKDLPNEIPDPISSANKLNLDLKSQDKTILHSSFHFRYNEFTTSFLWLSKDSFVVGLLNKYLKVYTLADPEKPTQVIPTRAVYGLTLDPNDPNRLASFFEVHFQITHKWGKDQCITWNHGPAWISLSTQSLSSSCSKTLTHLVNNNLELSNFYDNAESEMAPSESTFVENLSENFTNHLLAMRTIQSNDIASIMKHRVAKGYGLGVAEQGSFFSGLEQCVHNQCIGILSILDGSGEMFYKELDAHRHTTSTQASFGDSYPPLSLQLYSGSRRNLYNNEQYVRAAALSIFNLDFDRALKSLKLKATTSTGDSEIELICLALVGYANSEENYLWEDNVHKFISKLTERSDQESNYLMAIFQFLTALSADSLDRILYNAKLCIYDRVALACLYLNDEKLLNRTGDVQTVSIAGLHSSLVFCASIQEVAKKHTGRATDPISAVRGIKESVVKSRANVNRSCNQQITFDPLMVLKLGGIRLAHWVQCYRDLLNQWEMFYDRADFDIQYQTRHLGKLCKEGFTFNEDAGAQKDSLNSSTSAEFNSLNTLKGSCLLAGTTPISKENEQESDHKLGQSSTTFKSTVCQSCKTPLPRCSVCLLHLNTFQNTSSNYSAMDTGALRRRLADTRARINLAEQQTGNPFGNWFVWCQACRHGGHAGHIADWFYSVEQQKLFGGSSVSIQCPVNGCSCRCASLDSKWLELVQEQQKQLYVNQDPQQQRKLDIDDTPFTEEQDLKSCINLENKRIDLETLFCYDQTILKT
ncbi:hypothetical protein Ciccas_001643 [Cichlidogyrus casuarinus]|uniref:WD repeat protein mio zinc-ribbon like domain-containing protein n=1 Tax=Cichlidogyrus casuarinus TaxID=1844966 RepID=A0ABD2QJF2_9PLAT